MYPLSHLTNIHHALCQVLARPLGVHTEASYDIPLRVYLKCPHK